MGEAGRDDRTKRKHGHFMYLDKVVTRLRVAQAIASAEEKFRPVYPQSSVFRVGRVVMSMERDVEGWSRAS